MQTEQTTLKHGTFFDDHRPATKEMERL